MATRRKSRTPQGYRDGGAVPLDDIVAHVADGAPMAPAPAPGPSTDPAPSDDAAVLHALHATQRAEELHREAATKAPHEAAVDSMPGLSEAKRAFLKSNPVLLRQDIAPIASRHFQAALASGIQDDSPELEHYILEKTAADLEARRKLASGSARWRADDEAAKQAAAALEREANAFGSESRTARDDHDVEDEMEAPEPPPIRAPAARRSMPVSAPVSRDAPSMSTGRAQSFSDKTLSPAERDIARRSFTATDMTDAAKEYEYWKNREKMRAMRQAGTYE